MPRLALAMAAMLLLSSCGKKDAARTEPPPSADPSPEAAGRANTPADNEGERTPTDAVFVRTGPLAKARRLADLLDIPREGEISLELTLTAGEAWTIRQPVDDIDLPELPQLAGTPWLHLETATGSVLVPFTTLKSMTLAPVSNEKDVARARLVLQDGSELSGLLRGQLGGEADVGRFEAPWRALHSIELAGGSKAAPAVALPLAGKGVALLTDGSRVEFTSWAPVVGDVVSDVLLAESGTGPEMVPLDRVSAVEFLGSDGNAFFYQHAIAFAAGDRPPVRRHVALNCVLLEQANGCIVCLSPAVLQSITRS